MTGARLVDREFLRRDSLQVAPELLGLVLVRHDDIGRRRARIVEVEAYRGVEDAAAHSARGPTPRTETMFGPPGHLYVYLSYGLHRCMNIVCGDGDGHAVLLRAAAPLEGVDVMRTVRGAAARRDRDLCSGPGKLAQALGVELSHDSADLFGTGDLWLEDDGWRPESVVQTTRIGINRAVDEPWRWYVAGDPNVSRR